MSRLTMVAIVIASLALTGCGGSHSETGVDRNVRSREAAPPEPAQTSQPAVHARTISRLAWMAQPSRDVKKRLDRLLKCPISKAGSGWQPCDRNDTSVSVAPGDDGPVEHMDASIIDGELYHDKIRSVPISRFPFRVIDELFPNWPDRERWLRKALVEANHRPCPAAIKVDGAWIIVDGTYLALYRYRYIDLHIETTDQEGLRAERCWELYRAERQS